MTNAMVGGGWRGGGGQGGRAGMSRRGGNWSEMCEKEQGREGEMAEERRGSKEAGAAGEGRGLVACVGRV